MNGSSALFTRHMQRSAFRTRNGLPHDPAHCLPLYHNYAVKALPFLSTYLCEAALLLCLLSAYSPLGFSNWSFTVLFLRHNKDWQTGSSALEENFKLITRITLPALFQQLIVIITQISSLSPSSSSLSLSPPHLPSSPPPSTTFFTL